MQELEHEKERTQDWLQWIAGVFVSPLGKKVAAGRRTKVFAAGTGTEAGEKILRVVKLCADIAGAGLRKVQRNEMCCEGSVVAAVFELKAEDN